MQLEGFRKQEVKVYWLSQPVRKRLSDCEWLWVTVSCSSCEHSLDVSSRRWTPRFQDGTKRGSAGAEEWMVPISSLLWSIPVRHSVLVSQNGAAGDLDRLSLCDPTFGKAGLVYSPQRIAESWEENGTMIGGATVTGTIRKSFNVHAVNLETKSLRSELRLWSAMVSYGKLW